MTEENMSLFQKESSLLPFLAGFSAGALCAALLDPRRGAARRALLRDKATSLAREAGREAMRRGRDARQRTLGRIYETSKRVIDESVPDDILVERVRAQLGRPVSHPRAIEVVASDGEVTVSGPILRSEVDDLLMRVAEVRGVRQVNNMLQVFDDEGPVSSLQ